MLVCYHMFDFILKHVAEQKPTFDAANSAIKVYFETL